MNTHKDGKEYIPGWYKIDDWGKWLYDPYAMKEAVFIFLFGYNKFVKQYVD